MNQAIDSLSKSPQMANARTFGLKSKYMEGPGEKLLSHTVSSYSFSSIKRTIRMLAGRANVVENVPSSATIKSDQCLKNSVIWNNLFISLSSTAPPFSHNLRLFFFPPVFWFLRCRRTEGKDLPINSVLVRSILCFNISSVSTDTPVFFAFFLGESCLPH